MSDNIREDIYKLCHLALGNEIYWNHIGFDHLAKDYGQGSGTTCGFLPHWLLWRLGCNDADLINRSSPAQGFRWRTGKNLELFTKHRSSVVVDGALAKIMAGVKAKDDPEVAKALQANKRGPMPGEFVIIRGANWKNKTTGVRDRDSGHIFVLLDILKADGKNVTWKVAQTGLSKMGSDMRMLQGGMIAELKGTLTDGDFQEGPDTNPVKQGPHLVFDAQVLGEEVYNFKRRVTTFTDIDKISFGMVPDKQFTDLFEKRWLEQATNDWQSKISPWLGWYEETDHPDGGFIAATPTSYILLERGHEATHFGKIGGMGNYRVDNRGLWTREGSQLKIQWARPPENASGGAQAWSIAFAFERSANVGTPLPQTRTRSTLKSVKKMPPQLPAEWMGFHYIGD